MAVIALTPEGIVRSNVQMTPFFTQARAALLEGGYHSTSWVDYLSGGVGPNQFFATIKKDKIMVENIDRGFLFTTIKVQKVIDLLKEQHHAV